MTLVSYKTIYYYGIKHVIFNTPKNINDCIDMINYKKCNYYKDKKAGV